MRHPRTEELSDYLDGHLSRDRSREMEEHLLGCVRCASILRDLREIQSMARSLPDQAPPEDLWPKISSSISSGEDQGAQVIRLHPREAGEERDTPARRLRLSYIQAAAAALILALFSGSVGAFLASSRGPQPPAGAAMEVEWLEAAGRTSPELTGVAREIHALEERLARYGGDLDPETVRLLQKNLAIIDEAIGDSFRALEEDPGNPFLESHLARTMRKKATFLREATSFVAPAG